MSTTMTIRLESTLKNRLDRLAKITDRSKSYQCGGSGASMQIKWLRKALQTLESEASYIAKDDPAAARMVVQRIHNAVGLLAEKPALGYPGRINGARELVVPDTRYIVPYRVMPRLNRVEILRVFHTSRKLPESW